MIPFVRDNASAPHSEGISFTALYTGHVWYRNGLSARFFTSRKAEWLYRASLPLEWAAAHTLGLTIGDILLQRHRLMDHRIDQLVAEAGISQILEIACGCSPRGYAFSRKYPKLRYIEADLPDMAARKRKLLSAHQGYGPDHRVIDCDVFASQGKHSLAHLFAAELDPDRPTLVITEGLVNYFTLDQISDFWQRMAQLGARFPAFYYLTDNVCRSRAGIFAPAVAASTRALGLMTQAKVNLHFAREAEIVGHFHRCGYEATEVYWPENFTDTLALPQTRRRRALAVIEAALVKAPDNADE